MRLPKAISDVITSFERLPGIGPKTAQRLTFYLLHVPDVMLAEFANSLTNLKKNTVYCSVCFNISETNPCSICEATDRDKSIICVVESMLDLLAFEKSGRFKGVYHVLHGAVSPLNNIGPDEIKIGELITRIKNPSTSSGQDKELSIKEIILATNSNMEGEATAMYIANEVRELKTHPPADGAKLKDIKVTRLAHGLPVGGDVEYADEITLQRAMEGRREYGTT